jgi:hypothetical protein
MMPFVGWRASVLVAPDRLEAVIFPMILGEVIGK